MHAVASSDAASSAIPASRSRRFDPTPTPAAPCAIVSLPFPRAGTRSGTLVPQIREGGQIQLAPNELEAGVPDLDLVAGLERVGPDPLAVHLGAVRALEVLDRVDAGLGVEQD